MSKLTEGANGQSCILCGVDDGTVVSCHYSGRYQHKFGKGRGIRGADIAAADLCAEHHRHFDEYKDMPAPSHPLYRAMVAERSEFFLALCLLTVIRRIDQGILKC